MKIAIGAFVVLSPLLAAGAAGCRTADPSGEEQVLERLKRIETRLDRIEGIDQAQVDELLRRWPPPEWSEERHNAIARRMILEGADSLSKEESEFIAYYQQWQKAYERR